MYRLWADEEGLTGGANVVVGSPRPLRALGMVLVWI
jgi:hypothetical protein